jgi:uncharacterized phage infection (PIP) family protein YhgE
MTDFLQDHAIELGITALGGVLVFLGKREVARLDSNQAKNDKAIEHVNTILAQKPLSEQLLTTQLDLKFAELKRALEATNEIRVREAITEIQHTISALKDEVERRGSDSSHDLSATETKMERRVSELERQFNEWRLTSAEKYVSKSDFIRESTVLESRVSNTKRAVESLDSLLKSYLGGK